MASLASFVQISDIHFGDVDPVSFDAATARIWANSSVFDGLLGHSSRSLRYLEKFFRDRKRTDPETRLIVTGDLTTVGKGEQFAFADKFLGSIWTTPKWDRLGLRENKWKQLGIPGNHDHWPGVARIVGDPTEFLCKTFSPPWPSVAGARPGLQPHLGPNIALPTGQTLRFFAVDTDRDVNPWLRDRVMARGSFRSQLAQLSNTLSEHAQDPKPNEIRILLLHHSRSHTGYVLGMEEASRRALEDFILEHGIAVLLSGHLHRAKLTKSAVRNANWQAEVMEARCGTTTQREVPPYEWKTFLGKRPSRPGRWPNSLILHRVEGREDGIYWIAEVYQQAVAGFEKAGLLRDGGPVDLEYKVWPRTTKPVITTSAGKES
jgi:hypothetical protein